MVDFLKPAFHQIGEHPLQHRDIHQVPHFGKAAQTDRIGANLPAHLRKLRAMAQPAQGSGNRIEQAEEHQAEVVAEFELAGASRKPGCASTSACAIAKASRNSRRRRKCPRSLALRGGGAVSRGLVFLLNSREHPHRGKKYQ